MRIFACAVLGSAFASLGWCLPQGDGLPIGILGRSAGLALFGLAMLAAGLVFRAAIRSDKPSTVKVSPAASEFRRGFDKSPQASKRPASRREHSEVVVTLRRALAAQAQRPQADIAGVDLPADQVERLRNMLHGRAAMLRARNAEQAKRRFLRNGVDIHGLAQS
ncbi:MAG TPA: hypothetical protein VKV32_15765 [Stellaceae bacterium]|nr:hypothetical protein [Stellaceae bacterium]